MYTASFAFFEAIWDLGIRNCFVNLGSDHPGILEAIIKGQKERPDQFPRIFTCPTEMVALSMADGYARATNQPQCVIVHVDVGTSALGAAIHNASIGRVPVLIFAGLSPYTQEGELNGSRTEYIHWLQDVPDQKQIVSQYCRYVGEVRTGKNIKQMVGRALQFATSQPQGPVYLTGAREVMEEEIGQYQFSPELWLPVEPSALSQEGVATISHALAQAQKPLVITGYSGRNPKAVWALKRLANAVRGLCVLDTGGCDMCFPADHPSSLGMKYGVHDSIEEADLILVLNCDVPWIPTRCKPKTSSKVFHIDVDPMKRLMPLFYINAERRYAADSYTAINQIVFYLMASSDLSNALNSSERDAQWDIVRNTHKQRIVALDERAKMPTSTNTFNVEYLSATLRKLVPENSIFVVEAVTNAELVWDQIRPTIPGQWVNCGGGGLGWSGGGALGIKMGIDQLDNADGLKASRLVIQIVGDGSFMFSMPSSVYWMSQRYGIPILTIVLNNHGWNAPRRSMLLVHPTGLGSTATNADLNISFDPSPDYSGIAKAASNGYIFARRISERDKLESTLQRAIESVQNGQSAVLDALVR